MKTVLKWEPFELRNGASAEITSHIIVPAYSSWTPESYYRWEALGARSKAIYKTLEEAEMVCEAFCKKKAMEILVAFSNK